MQPSLKSLPAPSPAGKRLFNLLRTKDRSILKKLPSEEVLTGVELADRTRLHSLVFAALYGTREAVEVLLKNFPLETDAPLPIEDLCEGPHWENKLATLSVLAACRNDPKLLATLINQGDSALAFTENRGTKRKIATLTKTLEGAPAISGFLTAFTGQELTPRENDLLANTVVELHQRKYEYGVRALANFILSAIQPEGHAPFLDHPKIIALYPTLSQVIRPTGSNHNPMDKWLRHYATLYIQSHIVAKTQQAAPKLSRT